VYTRPFTSDGELAPRILYSRLYYAIIKTPQTTIDGDYLYPLLASTMLTLLQQQPLNQQRGQLAEEVCHWSGRPTLSCQLLFEQCHGSLTILHC